MIAANRKHVCENETAINENSDALWFRAEELAGVPAAVVAGLPRHPADAALCRVGLKFPEASPILL
jgi:hypothetical protein